MKEYVLRLGVHGLLPCLVLLSCILQWNVFLQKRLSVKFICMYSSITFFWTFAGNVVILSCNRVHVFIHCAFMCFFFGGWSLPQGISFFKAIPLHSRDKKIPSCTFKFISKSIYTSLKNMVFLHFFWCALHSTVVYGYLPCTVKPQRQNEILLINGL